MNAIQYGNLETLRHLSGTWLGDEDALSLLLLLVIPATLSVFFVAFHIRRNEIRLRYATQYVPTSSEPATSDEEDDDDDGARDVPLEDVLAAAAAMNTQTQTPQKGTSKG